MISLFAVFRRHYGYHCHYRFRRALRYIGHISAYFGFATLTVVVSSVAGSITAALIYLLHFACRRLGLRFLPKKEISFTRKFRYRHFDFAIIGLFSSFSSQLERCTAFRMRCFSYDFARLS